MTVLDVLTIIIVLALVAAGAAFIVVHLRRDGCDEGSEAFREEVDKLRAEVRELRSTRKRRSTFMDMADALNRLSDPPPTYDEAALEVPIMDLALGKIVRVRLLNGKEAEFRLPARTKSGTKFRFRRGGEDGRDLHLTVRAKPEKSDGT